MRRWVRVEVWAALVIASSATSLWAEDVWDAPPLSAEPAAILKALADRPRPEDADIEMIRQETTFEVDAERRVHQASRQIYRCFTKVSAQQHSFATADWNAWHEEKPQIEARVITADGKAFRLDSESIGEVTRPDDSPLVLSDRKTLQAPLPAMAAGCIVEVITRTRQTKPFCDAGEAQYQLFLPVMPTGLMRMIVVSPEDVPLKFEVRGIELEPKITKADGQVTRVYEKLNPGMLEHYENYVPADVAQFPYVAFTTGDSWVKIAAAYEKIVNDAIDIEPVKALAKAATAGVDDRRAKIQKLLDQMQSLVRYTGVEFGEAAIVPRTPAQTLARRYGDCKDQSVLLVAMLRAVGIEAHVALLRSGFTEDARPEMPALNMFNHAIVHVPGDPPLWIDPTARYLGVGHLPTHDQGRWALVASQHTKRLEQIPRLPSDQNVHRYIHEFVIRRWSPSLAVYRVESTGLLSQYGRAYHAERTMEERRQDWVKFGEQTYAAKSMSKFEVSDPLDFEKPLAVEARFENATLAVMDAQRAVVPIHAETVLEMLPDECFGHGGAQRKHALQIPALHVYETVYRVVPPTGYVPAKLPKGSQEKFGPLELAVELKTLDDQALEITYRVDTGHGLLTLDELAALQKRLASQPPFGFVELQFESEARRMFNEGKIKESLAFHRKLVADHPDEHSLRLSYAEGLMDAGLAQAARKEAQQVVDLEPENALAWYQLAYLRTCDNVGRQYQPGMDWRGAAEAYEKSLELEPKHVDVRWSLAVLLEHNIDGCRYAPDGQLKRAIEQYEKCLEQAPDNQLISEGLCLALLYDEDFARLKEKCAAMPPFPARDLMLLVATAATEGVDAAWVLAKREHQDEGHRIQLLIGASNYLTWGRQYSLAAEMMERAAQGHAQEEALKRLAGDIRKMKKHEDAALPAGDPRRPVQRLLQTVASSFDCRRDARELYSKLSGEKETNFDIDFLGETLAAQLTAFRAQGRPPRWCADWMGQFKLESHEIAPGLWQVTARREPIFSAFMVISEGDDLKILPPGYSSAELGRLAIQCVDQDRARAEKILSWVYNTNHARDIAWLDPYSGSPFGRLWKFSKHDEAQQVKLAAAALASQSSQPPEAIDLLKQLQETAQSWQKLQVDRALVNAYSTGGQGEALLAHVEKMLKEHPRRPDLQGSKAHALILLQRHDDLHAFAEAMLKASGDDPARKAEISLWLAQAGKIDRSLEVGTPAAKTGAPSPRLLNQLAWLAMFRDEPLTQAVDHAEQAVRAGRVGRHAHLHTLASVCAAAGKTAEARQHLLAAVEARPDRTATNLDQFVLGQLAERYELPQIAIECYQQVEKPALQAAAYQSWHVAQRRLAALKSAPSKK